MITIKKGHEPLSLTEFRAKGGERFEDLDAKTKEDIRESLLKEQGFLCAYCMKRIGRNKNFEGFYKDVKIEHIIPRATTQKDEDPNIRLLEINYNNLVAVCDGITEGRPHCDTSKKNRMINFHPCDKNIEPSVGYGFKDGEITSFNPLWNDDFNSETKLNLNHPKIKINRLHALEGLKAALNKDKNWSESHLSRKLQFIEEQSPKSPYIGIIKYYLRKKISAKK